MTTVFYLIMLLLAFVLGFWCGVVLNIATPLHREAMARIAKLEARLNAEIEKRNRELVEAGNRPDEKA